MLKLVVCGFQTGIDQAAARAAKSLGIATSGYMPLGWKTEDGPKPEYAWLYHAIEHESPLYPPRTRANVELAEAVIWLGKGDSAGFACTMKATKTLSKPFWVFPSDRSPKDLATLVRGFGYESINVAGSRESLNPAYKGWVGIGAWAETWLMEAFREIIKD